MKTNLLSRAIKNIQSLTNVSSVPETIHVKAGELIPEDGVIIDGIASVDESAIVGVSAPALLSADPGRNSVVAGGLVVEGSLTIRPNRR